MSLSTHCQNLRAGQKMGDLKLIDTMIKDGLWDAFNGLSHGPDRGERRREVADLPRGAGRVRGRLAEQGRSRPEGREKFADEIVPFTVKTRKGETVVDQDEIHPPRRDAREHGEATARLHQRTARWTAGNASGLNDGAAAALLMTADEAEKRGIEPLARIVSYANRGARPPRSWASAPFTASRRALEKGRLEGAADLDLVEANRKHSRRRPAR